MTTHAFRYKRFGYSVLDVPDIERSLDFCINVIGLSEAGQGSNGERFLRVGPNHHDVLLRPAKTAGFVRSGWQLETPEELDRAFAHFQKLELSPRWVPADECREYGVDRMFRLREPTHGVEFEYYARMVYISTPPKNTLTSFYGQGHIGIGVPDTKKFYDYLSQHMGFVASDILGDHIGVLTRCFPNPNHHSLGILPASTGKPDCHHIALMVNSIDDIGRFIHRAKKLNVKSQFGIGRHPTSGSIHYYVYDHDFFVWEYTFGMEQFPEVNPREPRFMSTAPEDYDLWGAMPDREWAGRNPAVVAG